MATATATAPRHKISIVSAEFTRTKAAAGTPGATPTGSAPTNGKLDLTGLGFGEIDEGSDPMLVEVNLPSYNPLTTNELMSLTAIAIPYGQPKPHNGTAWLASTHPKSTVSESPTNLGLVAAELLAATSATVGAVLSATSTTPPATAPAQPVAQPVALAAAGTLAAAVVPVATAPAVAAVNPAAPAAAQSPFLPGPAGGTVTFLLAGVPDKCKMYIQIIETY